MVIVIVEVSLITGSYIIRAHLSALLGVVEQAASVTIISPLINGSNLHNLIFSDDKVGYSNMPNVGTGTCGICPL